MHKDPQVALRDIRTVIGRFGRPDTAHWAPGKCDLPWVTAATKDDGKRVCRGEGHPADCVRAYELGDYQAFPDRPTAKQVADAVDTLRADLNEALGGILDLLESSQRQVQAVSGKHASHRHKVGDGHFSDRPDT